MKVISLKCNNCSADLKIPENTKFFNCTFCHSTLAIQHLGNTVFTEAIQDLQKDTAQLLSNSEAILLEKQISRLDRDWEESTKSFAVSNHKTGPAMPTKDKVYSNIYGLVLIGIGYFINISIFAPFDNLFKLLLPAPLSAVNLISLGFLLVALYLVFSSIKIYLKLRQYQTAKTHYDKQRKQLLQQLEKAKIY